LSGMNWNYILESMCSKNSTVMFFEKFQNALNEECSFMSRMCKKYNTPTKPWIPPGILRSIQILSKKLLKLL
jgi:hypothetical protein